MRVLLKMAAHTAVFVLVSQVVPGFHISGYVVAALAALVFAVCNTVIKPLLILVSLPATLLTLGLFLLVINAAVMGLAAALVPGFTIAGFWPALQGWLGVSLGAWVVNWVFKNDDDD